MLVQLASLTAALVLGVTGCIVNTHNDEAPAPDDDEGFGGSGGPLGPEAPSLPYCSGAGCYSYFDTDVAAGGTTRLSYATNVVVTSGPFEWEGDATVRAIAPGEGSIGGVGWRYPVQARPIGAIRLGPLLSRAPRMRYVRITESLWTPGIPGWASPLALHVTDPQAVIQLWSTELSGATRLVDASLALAEANPAIVLTDWDVIAVPPVPGTHRVVLSGDSFGSYELEIPVVDHIDRLEPRVWLRASHVGDSAIVCFYAFAGAYEVALDFTPTIDGPATGGGGFNCVSVTATGPGIITVSATADGVSANVELPID